MTSNNIQTPQMQERITNFSPVGLSILVPCTTISGSAAVAFPTPPVNAVTTDMLIYNDSQNDAWIAVGDATVTVAIPTAGVPANGVVVPKTGYFTLAKGNATYIAGITAASTADLYVVQGYGS